MHCRYAVIHNQYAIKSTTNDPLGLYDTSEYQLDGSDIMHDSIICNPLSDCTLANDIEMMLQAFCENDWQYYFEGECSQMTDLPFSQNEKIYIPFTTVNQSLSSAIKSPVITYRLNYSNIYGQYAFIYYNRETTSYSYAGLFSI